MDRPTGFGYLLRAGAHYFFGLVAAVGFGVLTQTNYDLIWLVIMGAVAALALLNLRNGGRSAAIELAFAISFAALGVAAFRIVGL